MSEQDVLNQVPLNNYTAGAGQTEFDFIFRVDEPTYLEVRVNGTLQVNGVDYTINSGSLNNESGGRITFSTGRTAGQIITLKRVVPKQRPTKFSPGAEIDAGTHELDADTIVMMIQDLARDIQRAPRIVDTFSLAANANVTFDAPIDGRGVYWFQSGSNWILKTTTASLDDLEAAGQVVANNIAAINAVAADIADVSAVAGIITNVNNVAAELSSVSITAANILNVNTTANNIASVNTTAGSIASVNAVAANMASVVDAANNIPKANLSATTNPTAGDDTADGYRTGSLWVNTSANIVWICTDASLGAAVWGQLGAYNPAAINSTGTLQLTGSISPATLTGTTQHDYNPTGFATANVVRLTASAGTSITGFGSPSAGRVIMLVCATTSPITLNNQNAGSAAANQIICPGGVDFILPSSANVLIAYDASVSRWRVVSPAPVSAATTSAAGIVRLATSAEIQSESPSGNVVAPVTGLRNSIGSAKGVVSFSNTGAIQQQLGNISSVTRNSTGNYTVNLSPSMANTNYSVIGTVNDNNGCTTDVKVISRAVGSFNILTRGTCDSGYGAFDCGLALAVFGTW